MLIETRPITPRRTGHARSWIPILGPFILLGVVVAVALAGNRPQPDPTSDVLAVTADDADPGPRAPSSSTPSASADPTAAIAFPTRVYDLPVSTVAEALAVDPMDRDPAAIVAIRAWLTIRYDDGCARAPLTADGRVLPDALCWKHVILGSDPSPAFAWQDGAMRRIGPNGAHLHAHIPPGVDREHLDREAVPMFGGGRRAGTVVPIPVVVVGRFGDPRVPACTSNGRHCGESFVVERVTWVAGDYPPDPVVTFVPATAGTLDADVARRAALRGLAGPTVVLSQALLAVDDLAGIDPAAADVVAAETATAPVEQLWFLRVLAPSGTDSPARTIRWLTLDGATGTVIITEPGD